uniref:Putative scp gapr-1 like scp-like extracellular protein n=2 Tax=Ixodes ricinus TaxID=34613 RepID=V5ID09_IXORI
MRTTVLIFMFSAIMMLGISEGAPKNPRRGTSHHRASSPVKKNNTNHDFHQLCRKAHNHYRAKHHALPLKSNTTLYLLARGWAKKLAIQDDPKNVTHRPGKGLGENIYWMTRSQPPYEKYATLAVEAWYKESENYTYSPGGYSPDTAHFTQLVWKSTTEVGCGYNVSNSGTIYVVCNYRPQGNIDGKYQENVLPPSSNVKSYMPPQIKNDLFLL